MKKALLLLVSLLFMSGIAFAETNLTDCGASLDVAYENYLLQNNVSIADYGICFAIGNYYTILDCQGYTINIGTDATGIYEYDGVGAYGTVKNCIFQGSSYSGTGIGTENGAYNRYINNTFLNLQAGMSNLVGNVALIENSTFQDDTYAVVLRSQQTLVKRNYFGTGLTEAIHMDQYGSDPTFNNTIYDNIFVSGAMNIYDDSVNKWNVTYTIGANIGLKNVLGTSIIGGNFWGSCTDNDCNGICDYPVVINAFNSDELPLSTCVPTATTPPPMTEINKISEIKICENNNLTVTATYGYCSNSTCPVINFTSIEACQYGCNAKEVPNSCNPSPFQAGLYFFLILVVIFVVASYFLIRGRRK